MKKTILFCHSVHHGNTRKLAEAARTRLGATVVALPCAEIPDLGAYERIGFLSGIYKGDFGKGVYALLDRLNLEGKTCFAAYTCGASAGAYDKKIVSRLSEKGARVLEGFHCRGYDTFGPFKLVGGIAKGRPNEEDVDGFLHFLEKL